MRGRARVCACIGYTSVNMWGVHVWGCTCVGYGVYDVCEFVLQFQYLPSSLAADNEGVGNRSVRVPCPRTRNTGCLSEEVTAAFTLPPGNRADAGFTMCREEAVGRWWAGHELAFCSGKAFLPWFSL